MSLPFSKPPCGPLPRRQAQLLQFIDARLDAGKRFPSNQEIATHMGWKNENSANDCLYRLAWRGELALNKDRKWERNA